MLGVAEEGEDAAVVPPDGGAEDGEFAEDLRVLKAEVEGDEASERGAAEGGVVGTWEGAVGAIEEGFDLVDQEAAVSVAFAACHAEVAGGGVLRHAAEAGVGDADEDDGFDFVGGQEGVSGGMGPPGASGDVGEAAVEEVLAVVEVEDGEAAGGVFVVGGGKVDGDVRVFGDGEDGGVEAPGLEGGFGVIGICWREVVSVKGGAGYGL